jgi:hypothetical protein
MTTYDFEDQKAKGKQGERFLDEQLSKWFRITPSSEAEQRQEIDRWFERDGDRWAVEYKTDAIAQRTHNAFVEMVSVDLAGKSGWAYTSKARWLIYYIPGDELIYVIEFERLRQELPRWAATYPFKSALNEGYRTWGLLVPLHEFERIAIRKHPFAQPIP